MIEGIPTRIDFKATNTHGMGIECLWAKVNSARDPLVKFKTFKFGMGRSLLCKPIKPIRHWNPNVRLVKDQATVVDFYTSDVEGNFYMVIEGLSEKGYPGFATISFQVSR